MQLRTISYEDQGTWGELRLELTVERVAPRQHLIQAIRSHDPASAFLVEFHVDKVATGHLQEHTGTTGYITGTGKSLHVSIGAPLPLAERPLMYGGPYPYLDDGRLRDLTSAQTAMLPELTAAITEVTPGTYQPHTTDLARLLAQEIPSQADVLRAYQRTSLTEIYNSHRADNEPARPRPNTVSLDFPQLPHEALHTAPQGPAHGAATHRPLNTRFHPGRGLGM
jgi:hypothetical protein